MLESFGARLRRRREEQDISLGTIAEQTKIKASLLEALERDDVSHWPSGIFRRAFIRAYAHAVGLNPDVVVGEFLQLYPDPIEVVAADSPGEPSGDGGRASGAPPIRLRYIVGSAIESLSKLRRGPQAENLPPVERLAFNVPPPAEWGQPAAPSSSEPDLPADAPLPTSSSSSRVEITNEAAADPPPVNEPAPSGPDLMAAAALCTELGRVETKDDVRPLLQDAARILDATGLVVWVWDSLAEELRPSLAHGYSDKVLAQLPILRADADNATAAAFRSAQTYAIDGGDHGSAALVVPLLTPAGCAGVLAMELQPGSERTTSVRAVATIFAAQLAQLVGVSGPAAARPQAEAVDPPAKLTPPIRRRVTARR